MTTDWQPDCEASACAKIHIGPQGITLWSTDDPEYRTYLRWDEVPGAIALLQKALDERNRR